MELKMKQPEFRKKSLFERVIDNVADAIDNVIDTISDLINSTTTTTTTTTSTTVTPTYRPTLSELALDAPIYLPKLTLSTSTKLNTATIEQLKTEIPIEVEKLTTDLIERVYTILAFASSGSATYEDILKFYMEKSADVSSLAYVDGMSAFTKVVIKIYNKVSNNTISEYGDILHTQTIALSVIWGAMMYSLIKKASSDPVSSEKTIVSRSVVSVAVALLQVMHREMPVWKYIGVIYKAYTTVGDWSRNHPTLYKVLFPSIYIDTARYPMWHKDIEKHIGYGDSKELAIGKAINMSYTFRIGDSFIEGMKNHTMLNDEVIRNFQNYLCPIPRDKEIKKLISLYVYDSIY